MTTGCPHLITTVEEGTAGGAYLYCTVCGDILEDLPKPTRVITDVEPGLWDGQAEFAERLRIAHRGDLR